MDIGFNAPRWLTLDAAAAYLGMTRAAFSKLIDARNMPPGIPSLGRLVWDRFALDVIAAMGGGTVRTAGVAPGAKTPAMALAPVLELPSTDALLPRRLIESVTAGHSDLHHRTVQIYRASASVRGPCEPPVTIRIEGSLTKARQGAARRFGSGSVGQEIRLHDAAGVLVAIRPAGRRHWDILI